MIKTIYILWFQGFDNSPEIVKRCINSWKYYNPDWNIVLLDENNLRDYVKIKEYIDISKKKISLAALSDIIRIILLNSYGGLWVDSTTFCNKSLNTWLPNYINKGFFAFNKPGPDRLISSWFIYSEKENYLTNSWLSSIINYYKIKNKPHNYFWLHYLFGSLYNLDNKFKQIWDKVPKLSANGIGPHYLQEKGMFNNITNKIKRDINNKITPLYKLTYKCNFTKYDESKNIYYLYSTIPK
jgi:hypothetical protein